MSKSLHNWGRLQLYWPNVPHPCIPTMRQIRRIQRSNFQIISPRLWNHSKVKQGWTWLSQPQQWHVTTSCYIRICNRLGKILQLCNDTFQGFHAERRGLEWEIAKHRPVKNAFWLLTFFFYGTQMLMFLKCCMLSISYSHDWFHRFLDSLVGLSVISCWHNRISHLGRLAYKQAMLGIPHNPCSKQAACKLQRSL